MESTCAAGQDGLGACCRLPSRCAGCHPPSTNTHSSGGLRSTQREDAHKVKDAGETQRDRPAWHRSSWRCGNHGSGARHPASTQARTLHRRICERVQPPFASDSPGCGHAYSEHSQDCSRHAPPPNVLLPWRDPKKSYIQEFDPVSALFPGLSHTRMAQGLCGGCALVNASRASLKKTEVSRPNGGTNLPQTRREVWCGWSSAGEAVSS